MPSQALDGLLMNDDESVGGVCFVSEQLMEMAGLVDLWVCVCDTSTAHSPCRLGVRARNSARFPGGKARAGARGSGK